MNKTLFAALILAALPTFAATPPRMPQWDAAALTKACDSAVAAARKDIAAMSAKKDAGTILAEWNRLQIGIEDVAGPVSLLGAVHPDKTVRDAAEPCSTKLTELNTEINQNEKLYARVKAVKPANAHQKKFQKDLLVFEDSGVTLPPDKRKLREEDLRQARGRPPRRSTATSATGPRSPGARRWKACWLSQGQEARRAPAC